MIYTSGKPIRIVIAGDDGFVLVEYQDDGATREVHVADLQADGGAAEIDEAIAAAIHAGRG